MAKSLVALAEKPTQTVCIRTCLWTGKIGHTLASCGQFLPPAMP